MTLTRSGKGCIWLGNVAPVAPPLLIGGQEQAHIADTVVSQQAFRNWTRVFLLARLGGIGFNFSRSRAQSLSPTSKQIPAEWLARHLRLATAHAFLQRETPPGIVWSLDLLSSSRLLIIHVLGLLDRGLRSVFNWVSLDNAPGQALGSPLSAPGNPWTKNMI